MSGASSWECGFLGLTVRIARTSLSGMPDGRTPWEAADGPGGPGAGEPVPTDVPPVRSTELSIPRAPSFQNGSRNSRSFTGSALRREYVLESEEFTA
ncbi:hypothetical protein GCM10010261_24710 [Streptomyces pilosus]|uniref:Uncharacterized protein n=1 Tax=Streptomyces pilosus TaxID=28893 RepID=A0A918BXK2_9ACTN|nr:hypothetical protein GCM10010280_48770 [Streptomyces pilosus]GGV48035.1 hypothetical protein GCM10010261_24710 [Streptomyces pilosus]